MELLIENNLFKAKRGGQVGTVHFVQAFLNIKQFTNCVVEVIIIIFLHYFRTDIMKMESIQHGEFYFIVFVWGIMMRWLRLLIN